MRVFVTGGSGFVGGHLVRRLVGDGHEVIGLARSPESAAKVEANGGTPASGSLSDTDVMTEAMRGCDVAYHCAAWVGAWGDPTEIAEANVEGTANVLRAAKTARVGAFVHVSTESVLLDGRALNQVDEREPIPVQGHLSAYAATKAVAERMVHAADAPVLRTVSVRPRFIWGPGDNVLLPALAAKVERGVFVWADGGRHRQSTTHVYNVVEALLLAAERGRGGEAYFVTDGPPLPFRDFATAYLGTVGLDPGNRSLPGWLIRMSAAAVEGVWKGLRLESAPPITRVEAVMASEPMSLDDGKARRELGYEEVITFEAGMAELQN
jgi:nucleoside-diphosphate-sugar epimerase